MFQKGANVRSKRQAAVTVRLASGEEFAGFVFLKYDERLIDLMNDMRAFIPVKRADDGGTLIVAKSSIASMRETFDEAADGDPETTAAQPDADASGDDATAADASETDPADDAQPEADVEAADAPDDGPEEPQSEAAAPEDKAEEKEPSAEESPGGGDEDPDIDADAADAPEEDPESDEEFSAAGETERKETRRNAPYKILRVSPDASLEEIKAAYKARIKAVHPDAHHGDDEERQRAAVQATQLVNRAYKAILDERGRNGAKEDGSDEDGPKGADDDAASAQKAAASG